MMFIAKLLIGADALGPPPGLRYGRVLRLPRARVFGHQLEPPTAGGDSPACEALPKEALEEGFDVEGIDASVAVDVAGAGVAGCLGEEEQAEE